MTSIVARTGGRSTLWHTAQVSGVALTLALIASFFFVPSQSLNLLWNMVIPLLPATFLINPLLWRNVCPLATINDFAGSRGDRRRLTIPELRQGWIVGIVLLFTLVPARRFLFNESGVAMAAIIIVVAALALVGGLRFARRAGFCDSICPVLPVEKLYGQAPLVPLRGVRCADCSLCASVGCIDLASTKVVAQTVGPLRRDIGWLRTSFGVFAAAFPGFIVGYFTAIDGPLTTAGAVYTRVLGCAVLSYAVVAGLTVAFRCRAAIAMPLLGGISLGAYYWYALPRLVSAYHLPGAAVLGFRVMLGAVTVLWMISTLRRGGSNGQPGYVVSP